MRDFCLHLFCQCSWTMMPQKMQSSGPCLNPNRSPAKRVRFGEEEQQNERALTFEKSRSKRYDACSDVSFVDKKDAVEKSCGVTGYGICGLNYWLILKNLLAYTTLKVQRDRRWWCINSGVDRVVQWLSLDLKYSIK